MNWRAVAFAIYLEATYRDLGGYVLDRKGVSSHPAIIGKFNGMWKRVSEG